MARSIPTDERALVRPSVARKHFSFEQWVADPPVDRFVARFWRTAWDLPKPFVQPLVTYPAVNLVIQSDGSAMVSGPQRSNSYREIGGSGWALGALFRSGGFRPFTTQPMVEIADRLLPLEAIFGESSDEFVNAVVQAKNDEARIGLFHAFLAERAPSTRTTGEDLSALIEQGAASTPPVTVVTEVAQWMGVSERTLQRAFREHVGLSPKAVLNRLRVQTAAAAVQTPIRSWAHTAHELGFADQAHLTSTLTAAYGAPPATFARLEGEHARTKLKLDAAAKT